MTTDKIHKIILSLLLGIWSLGFGISTSVAQGVRPPVDRLQDLTDVLIASPTNTQVLTYDSASGKWKNAAGGGAVSSVFGRTGAVTAQTGDYTATQVTNAADTAASYSNPSWITALIWSKITNTPVTLAGYGITGTLSEFNAALTGADFATGGGTVTGASSGTNTGDQTSVSGNAGTATALQTARNIDGQPFDGTANITVIAPGTHAASSKTTPVDADELPLVDSAASNVLKKLTWANLKATIKAYFDTLYPSGSGTATGTNTGDQASIVGITGTLAQFNTALTGADFATGGGTVTGASSGTNTGDQTAASLGLGTSDSPQFAGVNVGAATDTTITRTGAGDIAVEGNAIYRAGGTDVPVTDGGTGSSTAAGAATNLGLGTGDSPQFTGVNVGHATDTTISRASAGQIAVEGVNVLMNGGALGTPSSGIATNLTGTADGLTAGDVTRNHAVYAGASPPTVDVGVFTISVTGVNMKAAGTTTVFTVPTGRKFVCTGAYFIVTSVTTAGAGTETFKIQESGASGAMTAATVSGSGTPAVGTYYGQYALPGSGPFTACAAGNIVQVVVSTSQAGSTAVTGTIFVSGFYSA